MNPGCKKNTGLLFGSFDPVHTGHLIIANHLLQFAALDEVWFVLSPQNPFKTEEKLLGEQQRWKLLNAAIQGNKDFQACDIELSLPKPSYTIDSLKELQLQYRERNFSLIAGSDNLAVFDQWKDHQEILSLVPVFVYPRGETKDFPLLNHPSVSIVRAPKMDISSTMIRQMIAAGKHPRYLLPEKVLSIIKKEGYYGMEPSG